MTKNIDLDLITKEIDELKKAKAEYDFFLKQAKDEIEKRELRLATLLKQMDVNEMQHGFYSFGFKITQRQALDQKLLKEKFPKEYEACYLVKETEKFEFKINKTGGP